MAMLSFLPSDELSYMANFNAAGKTMPARSIYAGIIFIGYRVNIKSKNKIYLDVRIPRYLLIICSSWLLFLLSDMWLLLILIKIYIKNINSIANLVKNDKNITIRFKIEKGLLNWKKIVYNELEYVEIWRKIKIIKL